MFIRNQCNINKPAAYDNVGSDEKELGGVYRTGTKKSKRKVNRKLYSDEKSGVCKIYSAWCSKRFHIGVSNYA